MFLSMVHRTMTAMGFLVCRFGRFYVQFVCCLYCSLYQPTVAANATRQQRRVTWRPLGVDCRRIITSTGTSASIRASRHSFLPHTRISTGCIRGTWHLNTIHTGTMRPATWANTKIHEDLAQAICCRRVSHVFVVRCHCHWSCDVARV